MGEDTLVIEVVSRTTGPNIGMFVPFDYKIDVTFHNIDFLQILQKDEI